MDTEFSLVSVVGAARSGTTLLAEHILAHHPQIGYWSEPNHVWNYGNLYSKNEVRGAADASDEVKEHIRSSFRAQWEKQGRPPVVLEKTPANCLRIPFIREVFPDAKLIHLVRDGRDVALSAAVEWRGGKNLDQEHGSIWSRIHDGMQVIWDQVVLRDALSTIRLRQVPYYAWRALELIRIRIAGTGATWGPRIPGLREIADSRALIETCAVQWRECVDRVLASWPEEPAGTAIKVRYEDLLDEPRREVRRVLEFVGLDLCEAIETELGDVRRENKRKWESQLNDHDYTAVMAEIGSMLERLGYPVRD